MNIVTNIAPNLIRVYKVFSRKNGVLCSLSATGPLEKYYKVGSWADAEDWLFALGLGLFAFMNKEQALRVSNDKEAGGDLVAYACLTTELNAVVPKKMLSMEKNNPTLFTQEYVIKNLERGLGEHLEKGAVWCRNIFPVSRI